MLRKRETLFMETTTVPVAKSISEVCELLRRAGAKQIVQDFDGDGKVSALSFSLPFGASVLPYQMPIQVGAVEQLLRSRYVRKSRIPRDLPEVAARVAWRTCVQWLDAQIAYVRLRQVAPEQVFLAYLVNPNTGRTLYQALEAKGFAQYALTDGQPHVESQNTVTK